MKKIEGTLVYVQVKDSVKAFVKPGVPSKPNEWKASIVVTDKDVIKEYKKFAKTLDTLVSIKEVEASEFEDTYKCPLPEGAGDEVWVVTLRKSTELGKTQKPVPEQYRPRVYERVGKTLVDVTQTKMPANGSKGAISFDVFMKTQGGGSIFLKNVLVTEMIEYIKADTDQGEPGSEFDEDNADDGNGGSVKVPASAKTKPVTRAKPKVEDDDTEDPF